MHIISILKTIYIYVCVRERNRVHVCMMQSHIVSFIFLIFFSQIWGSTNSKSFKSKCKNNIVTFLLTLFINLTLTSVILKKYPFLKWSERFKVHYKITTNSSRNKYQDKEVIVWRSREVMCNPACLIIL